MHQCLFQGKRQQNMFRRVSPHCSWAFLQMRTSLDNVSDAFKRVIMDSASGKRVQQEAAQAAHLGYNVPQAQPAAYQATQAAYAPVQQQYPPR